MNRQIPSSIQKFKKLMLSTFVAIALFSQYKVNAQTSNVWLGGGSTPAASHDPKKPVSRGYITVSPEPGVDGMRLNVEVFLNSLHSPVTLSLFAVVNDGKGQSTLIPIKKLPAIKDNDELYYEKVTTDITYKELQAHFDKVAPAAGLTVEPGVAMFVKADFLATKTHTAGHNWGGVDRGGIFFLPQTTDASGKIKQAPVSAKQLPASAVPRPTALDIAFPIFSEMTNAYNNRATGAGLKDGGQIRSRVEGEGKFQLSEDGFQDAKETLFRLAANASEAKEVLGANWTIELEDRYMKRDANKKLIKGADGLPIPDPMVDTYYDNAKLDAAKNDMAIRYRWTEGNQTGSWNFKPGIGRVNDQGVTYRVEYGIDTTDDKPETLKKFIDSTHPLNVFQQIRQVIPGATPSDFLKPSVEVADTRYKFKLKHSSGLIIEVSADEVTTTKLDPKGKKQGQGKKFYQIEMDIDHLATKSMNQVSGTGGGKSLNKIVQSSWDTWADYSSPEAQAKTKAFLQELPEGSYFDGRVVLHDATDLKVDSPLLIAKAGEFELAEVAIKALREAVIGKDWKPGAQKYAFSAALLKAIPDGKVSKSVSKVTDMLTDTPSTGRRAKACKTLIP